MYVSSFSTKLCTGIIKSEKKKKKKKKKRILIETKQKSLQLQSFLLNKLFVCFFYADADPPLCNDYYIVTDGDVGSDPDPEAADRGVPFFPECETTNNNQINFSVKSTSDIAIFLAATSRIVDETNDDYYTISKSL